MKIDQKSLSYIDSVIKVANTFKIKEVIIELDKVRAIDTERSVFILHTDNVPEMPFGSIGIAELDIFQSRLAIAMSFKDIEFNATTISNNNVPFVQSINMKAKGFKVDFRCANPEKIQAPKKYNDSKSFTFSTSPTVVDMISKGKRAMKAEVISFKGSENTVSLEMEDINGDTLSYEISSDLVNHDELDTFVFRYPIDLITQLFKQERAEISVSISSKGILSATYNGFDIFLFPRR